MDHPAYIRMPDVRAQFSMQALFIFRVLHCPHLIVHQRRASYANNVSMMLVFA